MIAEAGDKANPGAGGAGVSSLVEAQKPSKGEPAGLPVLELPYDHPRAAMPGFQAASEAFALPESLSDSLREVSRREAVALDVVLLAVFHALLFRYTGQEDIAICASLYTLDQPREGKSDGGGRNPAIIRADLSGDLSFLEFLQQVRDIAAKTKTSLRVETCGGAPDQENGNGAMPLPQVFFSVEAGTRPTKPSNGQGYAEAASGPLAAFDLYVSFEDCPGGIRASIDYNARLFEAPTIRRMAGHFKAMLEAVAANPQQDLSKLALLTEAEWTQILQQWNDTETDYPRDLCLHEVIEAQADRTPHAIAAEYENQPLTYQQLDARANQLARHLQSLGVGPEDRVAVCLKRSLELPVALLGILKAGGACVPLDPNYPKDRLALMLNDSAPPVLLTDSNLLSGFAHRGMKVINLRDGWDVIAREACSRLPSSVGAASIAYVIYTSGSTGTPRGVLLPHGGLVNHGIAAVKLYGHLPSDRVLQFSSISFDIAVEELFPTWMCGAAVVLRPEDLPMQGSQFLHWVGQRRITVLDLPTAYWHELVHELADLKQPLPEGLRLVIVGGEKASSTAFAAWKKTVGNRVRWINTYGPSEASVIATAYEPPTAPGAEIPAVLPIGKPIANVKVYLLDQQLNPVPIGAAGELHIGGVGLARGYLNWPERTAAKFIPDPFDASPAARLYKTGDMARYLPSGEIEFVGRRDFQVKIRGFRVEPGEVEAALAKHPGVRDVVVVAEIRGDDDKRLVAYFVAAPAQRPTPAQLRSFLQEKLPPYMVPASFVMLEAMPLTPNGKVDRKALPASPAPETELPEPDAKPKDALELQLIRLWESVLGIRPIGVRQNFFDLGGHSLLAIRLMHRIEQVLQRQLPMTILLQAPTIEALASFLRQDGWAPTWSSLVAIQPRGSRPPFFCVHGIGGTVLRFRDLALCIGEDQPFYGLQAKGLDGKQIGPGTAEAMAADYIREVRQAQPEGPYFLGGYSFGGMIALEMAQQLRSQGQEVAFVGLIDTFPGKSKPMSELLIKLIRMPWREKTSYLSWRLRYIARFVQRRIARKLPPALVAVRKNLFEAEARYVPKVYPSRLTIFNASVKSLRSVEDPVASWSEWSTGGVDLQEIAGNHGNIFIEPTVLILA